MQLLVKIAADTTLLIRCRQHRAQVYLCLGAFWHGLLCLLVELAQPLLYLLSSPGVDVGVSVIEQHLCCFCQPLKLSTAQTWTVSCLKGSSYHCHCLITVTFIATATATATFTPSAQPLPLPLLLPYYAMPNASTSDNGNGRQSSTATAYSVRVFGNCLG